MFLVALAISLVLAGSAAATEFDHPATEGLDGHVVALLRDARDAYEREAPSATPERRSLLAGRLGELYLAHELDHAAESAFGIAHSLAPDELRWTYLLAHVLHRRGEIEPATGLLAEVASKAPELAFVRARYANSLLKLNRLDEARDIFGELAQGQHPNVAFAEAGLGRIAFLRREYRAAVDHLERALASAPYADQLHHTLAMAYRGLGDLDSARASLQRAGDQPLGVADPIVSEVQAKNRSAQYYMQRGRALMGGGLVESAILQFKAAVAMDPDDDAATLNLGMAYERAGRLEVARELYEQVVARSPHDAFAQLRLGVALRTQGRPEQALERIHEAVELRPSFPGAWYELGVTLMASARASEAVDAFGRLAELVPSNPQINAQRVIASVVAGDCDGASTVLSALESGGTEQPDATRALVRGSITCGHRPATANLLELAHALVEARPGALNQEAYAAALAQEGRFQEAIAIQETLLESVEGLDEDWQRIVEDDLARYRRGEAASAPYREGHPDRIGDDG